MSLNIVCNKYDLPQINYFGNEWILEDESGNDLSTREVIENLCKYCHNMFVERCIEDLERRNANERKRMSLKRYLDLNLGKEYQWWEEKGKEILALKNVDGVEFHIM